MAPALNPATNARAKSAMTTNSQIVKLTGTHLHVVKHIVPIRVFASDSCST